MLAPAPVTATFSTANSSPRRGTLVVALAISILSKACDGNKECDVDAGFQLCNGVCFPIDDDWHCGACGNSCGEREECVLGECVCLEGFTRCGFNCEFTESDPENCGGCGNVCEQPEPDCSGGNCTCGGQFCFPYCVSTSDHDNCLGCGIVCAFDQVCRAGLGCRGGDADGCDPPCDGSAWQICCATSSGDHCVDIRSDSQNCGACGNECICGDRDCGCIDTNCPEF